MFNDLDFSTLSDIDASIVNYVINNLETVSYMRVRDLAEVVHVSPSTIMRFVERVGFESFSDFKYGVKAEIIRLNEMTKISDAHSLDKYLNFDKTFDKKISKLVSKISKSKVIYCAGLGNSGIMADYFNRLISSLGYMVVSSKDGYLPVLWNQDVFDKNNVLLIFSVSGETPEILKLMSLIGSKHPYTVSITNKPDNSLARLSDMNIPYYIEDDRLMYHISMTSQLPLVYIIETVARRLHSLRVDSNTKPLIMPR